MILFELVNFEGIYQVEAADVRTSLEASGKYGSRWVEWSPKLSSVVEFPDVSIISSRNMLFKTLKKIISTTGGSIKILYGPHVFGLDCLCIDKNFSVSLLNQHILNNYKLDIYPDKDYRLGSWLQKIPMPLPKCK